MAKKQKQDVVVPSPEEREAENLGFLRKGKQVAARVFERLDPTPEMVFGAATVLSGLGDEGLTEETLKNAKHIAPKDATPDDIFTLAEAMIADEKWEERLLASQAEAKSLFGPSVSFETVLEVYAGVYVTDDDFED